MLKTIFLVLLFLLISGCRWFDDKPLELDYIDTDSISTTCKLNIDNIKNYMTKRVGKDLDCLYENIMSYRRNIYHSDPTILKKEEMLRFINTYMYSQQEFDPYVIDILFRLKGLILGGANDEAYYSQVKDFLEIMKIVNNGIHDFRDILRSYGEPTNHGRSDLYEIKNIAFSMATNISNRILTILQNYQSQGEPFLIASVEEMFNNADIEKLKLGVRRFEVFKSFIFGGEAQTISQDEFTVFLKKLPVLASGIYDLFIDKKVTSATFKNFFIHDINNEINSLEANLLTFLSIREEQVGTDDVFKEDLWELFENFGNIGIDPLMVDLFFDLKSLIVGGENTAIAFKELPDFSYVIKFINKSIQPLSSMIELENIGAHDFFKSRETVFDVSKNIAIKMRKFINDKQKKGYAFDLLKVKELFDVLEFEKISVQYDKFVKYKPYFVGGTNNILTQYELKELMDQEKLPILVLGIYDISFVKREYFPEGVGGYWDYLKFKASAYWTILKGVKFGRDELDPEVFIIKNDNDRNFFIKEDIKSLNKTFSNMDLSPELINFIFDLKVALRGGDELSLDKEVLVDLITILKIVDYEIEVLFSGSVKNEFNLYDKEDVYLMASNFYFKAHSIINRYDLEDQFDLELDSLIELLASKYPQTDQKVKELMVFLFDGVPGKKITKNEFKFIMENLPEFIATSYVFLNIDEGLFKSKEDYERLNNLTVETLLKYKNHFR